MRTWYNLKVPGLSPAFGKHGEATILFEDALHPQRGTYTGHLYVTSDKLSVLITTITFVVIDGFPPAPGVASAVDSTDANNTIIHLDIPENFAFLTLVGNCDSYQKTVEAFGPAAALDLFNAIHEWGVLDASHKNPSWYRADLHSYIDLDRLVDDVFYDEDVVHAINAAGHVFDSDRFASQLAAEQLVWELDDIPIGKDDGEQQRDATAFESWCERTLGFVLRGGFEPVVLHPNENAFRRRDVVAVNLKETRFCERIWGNYGVQHLIFEVKNKSDIDKRDIVQTSDYLTALYGRLGFVIHRSDALALSETGAWRFREILRAHGKAVIELTTEMLCSMLGNFAIGHGRVFDSRLCQLLNEYEHKHSNEPPPSKR